MDVKFSFESLGSFKLDLPLVVSNFLAGDSLPDDHPTLLGSILWLARCSKHWKPSEFQKLLNA